MAEIFLARSASLDGFEKDLVIKRIRPDLSDDEHFASLFIDEAKISISFTHPNVVQVFDFGRVADSYYLAMEYVHGCDLDTLLRLDGVFKVGMDPGLSLLVMGEVLKGLDYAHNKTDRDGNPLNVVHRDISPANILLSFSGIVKVADFGIAKAAGSLSQTKPGVVVGKLAYLSPEQSRAEEFDHRTDIFACGLVLWEMLVGRPARRNEIGKDFFSELQNPAIDPPSKHNPKIPAEIDNIVLRALNKNAHDRYRSAREFGHSIHEVLVKHFPNATPYALQAFLNTKKETVGMLLGYREQDELVLGDAFAPTLPVAEGSTELSNVGPLPASDVDWSTATIEQIEAFRKHPSLFRFIAMGNIFRREGQHEAAMVMYRAAAVKFSQCGLLAQALLCAHRMLMLSDSSGVRMEISLLPTLVGCENNRLEGHMFADDGPVSTLVRELLGDTSPTVGTAGGGTPLLSSMDGARFAELAATAKLQHFDEGEYLVSQGADGKSMFLLAEGRVLVHAKNSEGKKIYLSSLTAGDFFGENSFFTGAPRSATVEALYPSDVFIIDKDLYNRVMHDNADAEAVLLQFYKDRIVETVMAKSPTFGLLPKDDRRALVASFGLRKFEPGDVIIREGETRDEIYLIKAGSAEVFTEKGGPRTTLSDIGPGTIVGEVASIRNIPRTASVQAKTAMEALLLDGKAFREVLDQKPDVKEKVLSVVSQRARENIDKVMGGSPFRPR